MLSVAKALGVVAAIIIGVIAIIGFGAIIYVSCCANANFFL